MKQWLINNFSDFLTTFGLLALWLAEMAHYRQYKPIDVFLYDQGYMPVIGKGFWGIWEKRPGQPGEKEE